MNAALLARLRMIDWLLDHYGHFNRATLMDYFGLSTPQVSHDIREYIGQCPDSLVYDKTAKCYRKTDNFKRTFP